MISKYSFACLAVFLVGFACCDVLPVSLYLRVPDEYVQVKINNTFYLSLVQDKVDKELNTMLGYPTLNGNTVANPPFNLSEFQDKWNEKSSLTCTVHTDIALNSVSNNSPSWTLAPRMLSAFPNMSSPNITSFNATYQYDENLYRDTPCGHRDNPQFCTKISQKIQLFNTSTLTIFAGDNLFVYVDNNLVIDNLGLTITDRNLYHLDFNNNTLDISAIVLETAKGSSYYDNFTFTDLNLNTYVDKYVQLDIFNCNYYYLKNMDILFGNISLQEHRNPVDVDGGDDSCGFKCNKGGIAGVAVGGAVAVFGGLGGTYLYRKRRGSSSGVQMSEI